MGLTREEVAKLFKAMVEHFLPEKAAGVEANIQFNLSGDNGGIFWMRIADQTAAWGEGKTDEPVMTVKASAEDYAALLRGEVEPMQAYISGQVKIHGDMGFAIRFMTMFDNDSE